MKKTLSIAMIALLAGSIVTVDLAEAKRGGRSRASRPTTSAPVNLAKPATPSASVNLSKSPSTPTTNTATPSSTTTTPASGSRFGATTPSSTATPSTTAAPNATPSNLSATPAQQTGGSGIGGALLGAGAGLAGGYLLGQALSPDTANAAGTTGAQGLDYKNFCKEQAKGDAATEQACVKKEEEALALFRQCGQQTVNDKGVGSYVGLIECLKKGAPAPAQ